MADFGQLIEQMWRGRAEPALVSAEVTWDGDELIARCGGAARWLDSLELTDGAMIPALLDASPAAIAVAVGAALSARSLAPLNPRFPVSDVVGAVRNLGCPILLADEHYRPLAEEVAAQVGARVMIVEMPEPHPFEQFCCDPEAPAVIVHTSGTTGAPKPVFLTHDRLVSRIGIYTRAIGLERSDRYSSASPFFHTAGVSMIFTALGIGASVIPQAWFSPAGWKAAGELGATCALLVPTMIDMMLADGTLGDAHPRILQYGAMPISPTTLAAALEVLPTTRFVQIFGQTEVSPICALSHENHLLAINERPDLLRSVGRPPAGVELRVEDPDESGIGQICIRSPHTFQTDPDGWRRSGDLGIIDDEGFVWLHGRLGDKIIRGGENIYPIEIEAVLGGHPAVKECAVVGVPDQRWGEIVKAAVVLTDPSTPPDVAELQAYVRGQVAPFKVPSIVVFIDELPRNAAGKVLRRKLI